MLVALHKTIQRVWYSDIVAEALHQLLCFPQIVPGDAGEKVVNSLELQSSMNKVQPLGAVNIHRRSQHPLWE